jgi:GAF domain-containing protein
MNHTNDNNMYRTCIQSLESLIAGEDNFVANMANACAVLFYGLEEIRWAGFYLWDAERRQLVLGPFQGRPASTRLAEGKGICGEAIAQNMTQQQQGSAGSEIAIPLRQGRTIIGVLNLTSASTSCAGQECKDHLELFAARLVSHHIM